MENIKKIRTVIITLLVMFAASLTLLALMIPSYTPLTWTILVVLVVVILYFAGISYAMMKEIVDLEKKVENLKNNNRK